MLYNVVLVSAVQQNESATCIHISMLSFRPTPLGLHRALMLTILKVFIDFVTILFLFVFFGHEVPGILAPRPWMEPAPPVLGRQSLNYWIAREVPE